MDVKIVNPFVEAVDDVMPQLGFKEIKKVGLEVKDSHIPSHGVMALIGIAGAVKGTVIYNVETDHAQIIASTMMGGAPVPEMDEMAQSAISEMANMLCANASIKLSNMGMNIDISTPTLMFGKDTTLKVSVNKVLGVKVLMDNIPLTVEIAIE